MHESEDFPVWQNAGESVLELHSPNGSNCLPLSTPNWLDVIEPSPAALIADAGGSSEISTAKAQLIRRFAAAICSGRTTRSPLGVSGEKHQRRRALPLTSSLIRLVSKIGIARHAKEIVPSVERISRSADAMAATRRA